MATEATLLQNDAIEAIDEVFEEPSIFSWKLLAFSFLFFVYCVTTLVLLVLVLYYSSIGEKWSLGFTVSFAMLWIFLIPLIVIAVMCATYGCISFIQTI